MLIREVREDDYEAITGIYNPYITETTISFETVELRVEEMSERINKIVDNGYPCLVAEDAGKVIGYCYAHQWKERAAYSRTWETTIYMSPGYDCRGVGSSLMRQLIVECRNKGAHALIACITADNTASIEFHHKFGFRKVSLFNQVGFKHGEWLDVVDMELILD